MFRQSINSRHCHFQIIGIMQKRGRVSHQPATQIKYVTYFFLLGESSLFPASEAPAFILSRLRLICLAVLSASMLFKVKKAVRYRGLGCKSRKCIGSWARRIELTILSVCHVWGLPVYLYPDLFVINYSIIYLYSSAPTHINLFETLNEMHR